MWQVLSESENEPKYMEKPPEKNFFYVISSETPIEFQTTNLTHLLCIIALLTAYS